MPIKQETVTNENFVLRNRPEFVTRTEDFVPDGELERHAYQYVLEKHAGQMRMDKVTPVTDHLVGVASLLRDWMGVKDHGVVAAGLNHDVKEDGGVTSEELEAEFGGDIAGMVEGVTELKGTGKPKKEEDLDTAMKVVEMSGIDPRVALLKLADRIFNMMTLRATPEAKWVPKARETMEVYVPLAESLGVWEAKRLLEDLAAEFLYPKKMMEAKELIDNDPRLNWNSIGGRESELKKILEDAGIKGEIKHSVMGYWEAIKKKDESWKTNFRDVQLISYRIIVDDEKAARSVMSELRMKLRGINPDRNDDLILKKTYNGYAAIQETLETKEGSVEIAIETSLMEMLNRWGVVNLINAGEDLNSYRLKLIFNELGQLLMMMPQEGTGVDLIAMRDPELLSRAKALRVNGELKPITVQLNNAARVELILGELEEDWDRGLMEFARLSKTQEYLQGLEDERKKMEIINFGKAMLQPWLNEQGVDDIQDLIMGESGERKLKQALWMLRENKLGENKGLDKLYFDLAAGNLQLEDVIAVLEEVGLPKALTTVVLEGRDESGILTDVSGWIAQLGGVVVKVESLTDEEVYKMRLVIKGMTNEDKQLLEEKFMVDDSGRFAEIVII